MFQELVNKWRDERVARNQPLHVTQTHMVREFARWLDSQEIRPTPVPADGAVAPIKCAECGDEIYPVCEACVGDMRRR